MIICQKSKSLEDGSRLIFTSTEKHTLDQSWLNQAVREIGLSQDRKGSQWSYDQYITTYGILKHGITTQDFFEEQSKSDVGRGLM